MCQIVAVQYKGKVFCYDNVLFKGTRCLQAPNIYILRKDRPVCCFDFVHPRAVIFLSLLPYSRWLKQIFFLKTTTLKTANDKKTIVFNSKMELRHWIILMYSFKIFLCRFFGICPEAAYNLKTQFKKPLQTKIPQSYFPLWRYAYFSAPSLQEEEAHFFTA